MPPRARTRIIAENPKHQATVIQRKDEIRIVWKTKRSGWCAIEIERGTPGQVQIHARLSKKRAESFLAEVRAKDSGVTVL